MERYAKSMLRGIFGDYKSWRITMSRYLSIIIVWLCIGIIMLMYQQKRHMQHLEQIIYNYNIERMKIYKGEK